MAYKQTAGREPMAKTGRGIPVDFKQSSPLKQEKKVDVTTHDAEGNQYSISVGANSPHSKGGAVARNLRGVSDVNERTDPWASGISAEEKQKRMKEYGDREKKA